MKKLFLIILLLGGFITTEAQTIVTSTNASTSVKYEEEEVYRKSGLYLRPESSLEVIGVEEGILNLGVLQGTLLFQAGPRFNVGFGGGYYGEDRFSYYTRIVAFFGDHKYLDYYMSWRFGFRSGTICSGSYGYDDYDYYYHGYDGFFIEWEAVSFNFHNFDISWSLGGASTYSYESDYYGSYYYDTFSFMTSLKVAYNIPLFRF